MHLLKMILFYDVTLVHSSLEQHCFEYSLVSNKAEHRYYSLLLPHKTGNSLKMNGVNDDQSLTVLRNYLRYAISSIVYHKLFLSSSHNECNEQKLDEYKSKRRGKQQHSCFVEREFCGLSGLKYMDAVTDDGNITNMDGTYALKSCYQCNKRGRIKFALFLLKNS